MHGLLWGTIILKVDRFGIKDSISNLNGLTWHVCTLLSTIYWGQPSLWVVNLSYGCFIAYVMVPKSRGQLISAEVLKPLGLMTA